MIAVAGSIAQRPNRPGHAWVFLNYLLGFRQLGYEVLFVDRVDSAPQARWLAETMELVGLEGCHSALVDGGLETVGLPRQEVVARIARSELLINVNGFLTDPELLAAAPRRAYLDIDPGFAQIWEAQGLADTFAGHDDFITVGTNVGGSDSLVPTGGRDWVPTLPPVMLDRWPPVPGGSAFTSVGSWRGPFGPLTHDGYEYGLRVHEFRRFLELPARVGAPFELALDIDPEDGRDAEALRAASWRIADPLTTLAGFESYQRFVQGSLAEIAIAKGIYVGTRGGWFSDRSASYLASGKPVVAQETGFSKVLPTGHGLLAFEDLDGAARAAEEVCDNPREHAEAARAIAEEHLDSRKVLARLLERLGAA
jgi:glycosyltransferase involved in cell wall biosynthesis